MANATYKPYANSPIQFFKLMTEVEGKNCNLKKSVLPFATINWQITNSLLFWIWTSEKEKDNERMFSFAYSNTQN